MTSELEPGWTTLKRETIHAGRVRLVDHTALLPDGSTITYEVDESIPFAVATLVIDGDVLLLSRQYRYPIDRWILDLPGGAGDAGESPEEAARRELREELGLVAARLLPLHTFFVNPGRSAWPVHLFAATLLSAVVEPDRSDPSEQVHLIRVSITELDEMIRTGEIVDPALVIARAMAAATGLLPALGSARD